MVVIVANLADIVFKADGMVVNGTVAFYIIGEAVSILENCSLIGVPLPELLTKRLGIKDDKNIKIKINKALSDRALLLELINYDKRIFREWNGVPVYTDFYLMEQDAQGKPLDTGSPIFAVYHDTGNPDSTAQQNVNYYKTHTYKIGFYGFSTFLC